MSFRVPSELSQKLHRNGFFGPGRVRIGIAYVTNLEVATEAVWARRTAWGGLVGYVLGDRRERSVQTTFNKFKLRTRGPGHCNFIHARLFFEESDPNPSYAKKAIPV